MHDYVLTQNSAKGKISNDGSQNGGTKLYHKDTYIVVCQKCRILDETDETFYFHRLLNFDAYINDFKIKNHTHNPKPIIPPKPNRFNHLEINEFFTKK